MANTTNKKQNGVYNPYDAVKGWTETKGLYNMAKATGGDYKKYALDAIPYYEELYENGYADLADEMSNVDYDGALKISERFSPTSAFEDYVNSINAMERRENTAGMNPTTGEWQDKTTGYLDAAQNPKASETAQKVFDAFYAVENTLNGPITHDSNGNVVSGLNIDHYNSGKGQLDYLQDFDVTSTPYFSGIMAQYNLLGGDAAQGELAEGAAENSGNIDSFAQANANRQQLAFTTAGINQALAAANQNQQNWQNVYNQMTQHLYGMGALNNQKLGYATDIYATDSAERQNAVNAAAKLAEREMMNNMQWYLDLLDYDKTMDQKILDTAAGLYKTDVTDATDRYGIDKTYAGTVYESDKEFEGKKLDNDIKVSEAQKNRQHEMDMLNLEQGYARQAATEAAQNTANLLKRENMIFNSVNESVWDYIFNDNSPYSSTNDIYKELSKVYKDYNAQDLYNMINTAYEKMAPKEDAANGTNPAQTDPSFAAFVSEMYLGLIKGTYDSIKTYGDAISAIQEAYGIGYDDAKKALDDAKEKYDDLQLRRVGITYSQGTSPAAQGALTGIDRFTSRNK